MWSLDNTVRQCSSHGGQCLTSDYNQHGAVRPQPHTHTLIHTRAHGATLNLPPHTAYKQEDMALAVASQLEVLCSVAPPEDS